MQSHEIIILLKMHIRIFVKHIVILDMLHKTEINSRQYNISYIQKINKTENKDNGAK